MAQLGQLVPTVVEALTRRGRQRLIATYRQQCLQAYDKHVGNDYADYLAKQGANPDSTISCRVLSR